MLLRLQTVPAGNVKVCCSHMGHLLGDGRVEIRPINVPVAWAAVSSCDDASRLPFNTEAVLNGDRSISGNPVRQIRCVRANLSSKRSFAAALLLIEVFR